VKIYLIEFNNCTWDQYKGFVVIAKDKKDVISLIESEYQRGCGAIDWNGGYKITEVIPKKRRKIILEDFHAG